MKKIAVIPVLALGMLLCGCGGRKEEGLSQMQGGDMAEMGRSGTEGEAGSAIQLQGETWRGTRDVQGGPYGEISISIPDGWRSETFPMDSDEEIYGMYGIKFYPEGVADGYVTVVYQDSFGVCGTGLSEEQATIAGYPASIGTYDNQEYWDFIAFEGEYRGVVALTYCVDAWWNDHDRQVMDILNTLSFDQSVREGGAYVYSSESEVSEVGVYLSLKNISPTGATLVFSQYDADAPKGELIYGEEYVLERRKDGSWESVPTVIEDYGFNLSGSNSPQLCCVV